MSEAHTKGPWHWWTSNSWKRLMTDHEDGKIVRVLEPYVVRDSHADLVVSEADMKLIAAAPDMLDALRICLGHMTGGMDGDWKDCNPIDVVRSAIEKATSQI